MELITARNIVRSELNKHHCKYIETASLTTNSIYFNIVLENASFAFRISDHRAHININTVRIDYRIKPEVLRQYVRNRIKNAQDRNLEAWLHKRHY